MVQIFALYTPRSNSTIKHRKCDCVQLNAGIKLSVATFEMWLRPPVLALGVRMMALCRKLAAGLQRIPQTADRWTV